MAAQGGKKEGEWREEAGGARKNGVVLVLKQRRHADGRWKVEKKKREQGRTKTKRGKTMFCEPTKKESVKAPVFYLPFFSKSSSINEISSR